MDPGEQITGTRDEHYNLISVLYHALHGAETIDTYVLDAESAGDEELAAFFLEVQETHREIAQQVKERLGIGEISAPGMAEGSLLETEIPLGSEPVDVRGRVAPEVGLPPEGAGGPEVPPETDVPPEPPPTESQEPPPPGPPRDTNPPA